MQAPIATHARTPGAASTQRRGWLGGRTLFWPRINTPPTGAAYAHRRWVRKRRVVERYGHACKHKLKNLNQGWLEWNTASTDTNLRHTTPQKRKKEGNKKQSTPSIGACARGTTELLVAPGSQERRLLPPPAEKGCLGIAERPSLRTKKCVLCDVTVCAPFEYRLSRARTI